MNWIRRSLTFKLLGTLLFTGLSGIGLVWFFANRTTVTGFDQLKLEQAKQDIGAIVQIYYETHGTWFGFHEAIEAQRPQARSGSFGSPLVPFILADESNNVVQWAPPFHPGDVLTEDQLAHGTAVIVNGTRVGTVLFTQDVLSLNPLEQRYLSRINHDLVLGAIGAAGIALIVGIVLTRHFLRPLRDLTLALGAMRQGNLKQEVPVRSHDELGELIRTFNQMSKDLAHANFLRRQMTADIAHDLRTPLTVIGGYLEGLQDGTLKPTPLRFETMHSEVLRLKRLVEDLRTLSLADAGALKLMYQPVQVEALMNHVAASFQPLFDERQLHLEVQVESGLPAVNMDQERMAQVLGNLVSNAMRHTPSGGTVVLQGCKAPETVDISVRDTGEGIPLDKLPYIFERLYRVDESRHDEDESGLGLAIVKSIVEAHGSTVTAQSEIGKGTTITIQIPNKLIAPAKAA